MKLSPKDIKELAILARLELSDSEITRYSEELSAIVEYVKQLGEVDVKDIEPTNQVTGLMNVLRNDQINTERCITNQQLKKIASDFENGYVKIPPVF